MILRPAAVRYYVDQDLMGLGKILGGLRADVTYPGDRGGATHNKRSRPPSPIALGAADEDWIPVVAERGWLIISRDKRRACQVVCVSELGHSGVRGGG